MGLEIKGKFLPFIGLNKSHRLVIDSSAILQDKFARPLTCNEYNEGGEQFTQRIFLCNP